MDKLWSAKDVAELLGRSEKYVYQLALEQKIPAVRLSKGTVRFDPLDIRNWIKSRKQTLLPVAKRIHQGE